MMVNHEQRHWRTQTEDLAYRTQRDAKDAAVKGKEIMENKWTPGPWFATSVGDKHSNDGNGPDFWLIDAVPFPNQETAVAELCHKPGNKAEANAHLIAAAPDMAETLQNIENDDGRIPETIWEMRNAALAKARGET